jgi:hypothetical protein
VLSWLVCMCCKRGLLADTHIVPDLEKLGWHAAA